MSGKLSPFNVLLCNLLCRPEAAHMDPQQRLLLEHSWEALQQVPCGEVDPSTSVIVGIGTVDYTGMASHLGPGIYAATGVSWGRPLLALDIAACLFCMEPTDSTSAVHCIRAQHTMLVLCTEHSISRHPMRCTDAVQYTQCYMHASHN
jgi:hypothetical protein